MKQPIEDMESWLAWARNQVEHDNDVVLPISGRERSGKSTLGFKIARVLDPYFSAHDVMFRAWDYIKRSKNNARRRAQILDEPRGVNAMEVMSPENRAFNDHITVCGELNQIHIICVPRIRRLDPNIRDHRAIWRAHILRRGLCAFYKAYRSEHGKGTYWKRRFTHEYTTANGDPEWMRVLDQKHQFVIDGGRDAKKGETNPDPEPVEVDPEYAELLDVLQFVPAALAAQRAKAAVAAAAPPAPNRYDEPPVTYEDLVERLKWVPQAIIDEAPQRRGPGRPPSIRRDLAVKRQ